MSAQIHHITDGFEPARRALQDVKSSPEVRACAIDVLSESRDWRDIRLISESQNLLWAGPHSEIIDAEYEASIQRHRDYLASFPIIDSRVERYDAMTDERLDDIYGATCVVLLIALGVVAAVAGMIGLAAHLWWL